jgi:hypothetical protein
MSLSDPLHHINHPPTKGARGTNGTRAEVQFYDHERMIVKRSQFWAQIWNREIQNTELWHRVVLYLEAKVQFHDYERMIVKRSQVWAQIFKSRQEGDEEEKEEEEANGPPCSLIKSCYRQSDSNCRHFGNVPPNIMLCLMSNSCLIFDIVKQYGFSFTNHHCSVSPPRPNSYAVQSVVIKYGHKARSLSFISEITAAPRKLERQV